MRRGLQAMGIARRENHAPVFSVKAWSQGPALLQGSGRVTERLAFLYPSGIQLPEGQTAR